MQKLHLQDDIQYFLNDAANPWLVHEYPTLQHLQLEPRRPFEIGELREFFEKNSNIRSFSTNSGCLWENRNELIKSTIQLEILEVTAMTDFEEYTIDMRQIFSLLHQLYERNFYKRLHMHVKHFDRECSELLGALNGLEKLTISEFGENYRLRHFNNLIELDLPKGASGDVTENLAMNLGNLKYLRVQNISCNDIRPFVRRSAQLQQVYAHFNEGTLNLPA